MRRAGAWACARRRGGGVLSRLRAAPDRARRETLESPDRPHGRSDGGGVLRRSPGGDPDELRRVPASAGPVNPGRGLDPSSPLAVPAARCMSLRRDRRCLATTTAEPASLRGAGAATAPGRRSLFSHLSANTFEVSFASLSQPCDRLAPFLGRFLSIPIAAVSHHDGPSEPALSHLPSRSGASLPSRFVRLDSILRICSPSRSRRSFMLPRHTARSHTSR